VVVLPLDPHARERQPAQAALDQASEQIRLASVSRRFDSVVLENLLGRRPDLSGNDRRDLPDDHFMPIC
jgi:hypothetical protein